MKKIIILLFVCVLSISIAQAVNRVKVRIFSNTAIEQCSFFPLSNKYTLMAGDEMISELAIKQKAVFSLEKGMVVVTVDDKKLGSYKEINLKKKGFKNSFQFKVIKPNLAPINYDDDLIVRVKGNKLLVLNDIDVDYYVAGVVEAEGGAKALQEYYKAQSILSRTYMLGHIDRHKGEGYQLCDQVHCQAYKGRCHNSDILMASIATRGMILIDSSGNYVSAVFHSNCGGQTIPSDFIWPNKISYLQSVKDTFCLKMPHAKWEVKVSKENWLSYLQENGCAITADNQEQFLNFKQMDRKSGFDVNGAAIPLKQIRSNFRLQSTFFETCCQGDSISIKGVGFGHGVGMCQEGAMQMAVHGKTFEQIIHFYFANVKIKYVEIAD